MDYKKLAERLALDAIGALAKAGIETPEEGYIIWPNCLAADIRRLQRQRDDALYELAQLKKELLSEYVNHALE